MMRPRRRAARSGYGVPASADAPRARPPRVRADHAVPLWVAVAAVAAVLALAGLAAHQYISRRPPTSLDQAVLQGPRLLHGPVCLALATDVSGSMNELADARRRALADLLSFSRRSLASDDVLAAVAFDDKAWTTLPPARVESLPASPPIERPGNGSSTEFAPAVDAVARLFRTTACSAIAVASITDGQFGDAPGALRAHLDDAALTRVRLLLPGGRGRPAPLTAPELVGVQVAHFDAGDTHRLGLLYGQLLADLTGQRLVRG